MRFWFTKKTLDNMLSTAEERATRSSIGALLWLALTSRPDISYSVIQAASSSKIALNASSKPSPPARTDLDASSASGTSPRFLSTAPTCYQGLLVT